VGNIDLLLNPAAGQGRAGRLASELILHLEGLGLSVACHRSLGPGHLTSLARELTEDGASTIAIAGGDGTLFETVNGCFQAEGPIPDLALIPLGSGNDFAKSLGIPKEWPDACDRLILGTKRRVDVGQCNGLYFLNSLGIGLDAEVARSSQGKSWLPRQWRYQAGLLQALIRSKPVAVEVVHDQGEFKESVTLLMVANGGYEGGNFYLAPQADIEDGRLDLVLAPALTRRQIVSALPKVEAGEVSAIPGYQHFQTRRIRIRLPTPCCVHADGEMIYARAERLDIGVVPGALSFLS